MGGLVGEDGFDLGGRHAGEAAYGDEHDGTQPADDGGHLHDGGVHEADGAGDAEAGAEGVEGAVPHYLPGKNPFIDEDARNRHIPLDALMGGAETTYPEYRKKLKDSYVAPEKCVRYCCGGGNTEGLGGPAP